MHTAMMMGEHKAHSIIPSPLSRSSKLFMEIRKRVYFRRALRHLVKKNAQILPRVSDTLSYSVVQIRFALAMKICKTGKVKEKRKSFFRTTNYLRRRYANIYATEHQHMQCILMWFALCWIRTHRWSIVFCVCCWTNVLHKFANVILRK